MGNKNINTATALSTITSGDKVFVSDEGTSLRKADIAAIAKYIVENYAGSTLGGSARSVKTVVDALNSKALRLTDYTTVPGNSNLNSYTTIGCYSQSTTNVVSTITNVPENIAFTLIVEDSSGSTGTFMHRRQIFKAYNGSSEYERAIGTGDGGSTWTFTDWKKAPTRAEMYKSTTIKVMLHDLTWSHSGAGVYYVSAANGVAVPNAVSILAVSLTNDFSYLTGDFILPVVNTGDKKICFISSTDAWNASAYVYLLVLYT